MLLTKDTKNYHSVIGWWADNDLTSALAFHLTPSTFTVHFLLRSMATSYRVGKHTTPPPCSVHRLFSMLCPAFICKRAPPVFLSTHFKIHSDWEVVRPPPWRWHLRPGLRLPSQFLFPWSLQQCILPFKLETWYPESLNECSQSGGPALSQGSPKTWENTDIYIMVHSSSKVSYEVTRK